MARHVVLAAFVLACGLAGAQVLPARTPPAAESGAAVADKVDHAPVIQRAIDATERAGGGIVRLAPGTYRVAVDATGTAIRIPAGVTLDLTGSELRLIENDRRAYQVLLFTGRDRPSGVTGGRIVGDRERHLGHDGEWGMCISVRGASDVTIRSTQVFDCWGDGIYVGRGTAADASPSRRITIEGVEAGRNRRNNISIVAASGFRIANVHLHGASGTAPQAGIDLEPNEGDVVEDGEIVDMLTERNAGRGFVISGHAGPVRRIAIDRIRSLDNGATGYLLQTTSALRIGTIESVRNRRHGLSIVRASDITVRNYASHDNGGSVLYTNTATRVHLGDVAFSGTPQGVLPMRIDPRSSVSAGP